jgi:SAM-dependent methyltransferase
LSINFVHGDMRELDFESQFDGVFCLFSTFGYFDEETNKKTAANMARALKPGARAVIEILNRDYVVPELPTRVWWEGDGCVVLEEVEFNYFSSRIQSNRSIVFDDGRQVEQEISLRAYSLHELGKLLHAAGFRVVEVSGSVHTPWSVLRPAVASHHRRRREAPRRRQGVARRSARAAAAAARGTPPDAAGCGAALVPAVVRRCHPACAPPRPQLLGIAAARSREGPAALAGYGGYATDRVLTKTFWLDSRL